MPPERVSWYVLYKPAGVVTTLDDPQGRPTVLGLLGTIPTRVFPIGRLDWDAEGALLLTDDGSAAHRLLHPSFQVPRTYLAKVKGVPTDESLARLLAGVRLEDGLARALEVERFQAVERNTWLRVTVGEGRPHLVKRLCAAIGHPVVRLFRPHQAGISVAGMQPGELRALRPEELALIAAVAGGQPVPPMTLTLPARRHGRADEDSESDGAADGAPRPPKPPRFGTRPWRNAAAGASGPRQPRQGTGEARKGHGRGASARPEGLQKGGSSRGRPGPFDGERDAGRRSPPESGATWAKGGRSPQRGGVERGGPSRRADATTHGRAGLRDVRGGAGHGAGASTHRPGRTWPGFEGGKPSTAGEGLGRKDNGRDFRAKPAGSRRGEKRGPPGGRGGYGSGRLSGRGEGPGQRDGGGRDFRAKPAGSRGGWSGDKRGPVGARGPGRGEGTGNASGGRDSRAKPAGSRGGWSGARREPPFAARGEGRGGGPPPEGPKGARGVRRGAPGERPPGGSRWTGMRAGAGYRPRPGSGPRPSNTRGARGRPPQGPRGPPRPRGAGPRGPKR
jgi:23S rRNA pseudouridine2605 synthase